MTIKQRTSKEVRRDIRELRRQRESLINRWCFVIVAVVLVQFFIPSLWELSLGRVLITILAGVLSWFGFPLFSRRPR